MTHGGLDNNIEHLIKITTQSAVAAASASFEDYWKQAEDVTQDDINRMVENAEKDEDRKDRPSRSQSRSVSRSLSKELDEEGAATRK